MKKNTSNPPKLSETREAYIKKVVDQILWAAYKKVPCTAEDIRKAVGNQPHHADVLGFCCAWALRNKVVIGLCII